MLLVQILVLLPFPAPLIADRLAVTLLYTLGNLPKYHISNLQKWQGFFIYSIHNLRFFKKIYQKYTKLGAFGNSIIHYF